MIKFQLKTKRELFNALKKENPQLIEEQESKGIMDFLNEIWDLNAMPSEDPRFKNAYRDIYQHIVNNNDWDIEYLFIERLNLLNNDDTYNKFIKSLVNHKYRIDDDDVIKHVLLINSYIEKENYTLTATEFDEYGRPVYTIQKLENKNVFLDLPVNRIPFHIVKTPQGHSDWFDAHNEPKTKPAFMLVYNDTWNDYSYWTEFSLFFYSESEKFYIGATKITDGESSYSIKVIPKTFQVLPDNFCSLGQSRKFYQNLKKVTGTLFESVLFALKDVAFFPDIHDKFENNQIFKDSLIRFDLAEQNLREAKHLVYNYDLSNLYSFKYSFNPKYSEDSVDIEFNFNKDNELPSRIYAIIGKNGTGKTQLITSLPLDISKKHNDLFTPRPPLFSKVIAVSYSIFDNFDIPQKTSTFNYVYCGLFNIVDGKKEILTLKQQTLRFHRNWKRIKELERMEVWRNILLNFIDDDIVNGFIVQDDSERNSLTVNIEYFNKVKEKLSSGQSILLFVISEIISNIRLDSLILFDEPETHLHPNAISQLMNLIYDLVHQFESYCIISTHSPLIIQELLSKNVYVIERHENTPSIRKIGLESFGENLTVLTEEVFGNKEISKQYKKIVSSLVDENYTYEEIVRKLESDGIPLSLNTRLYIKSQILQ